MKSNLILQMSLLALQMVYSQRPPAMLMVLRCVRNVQFCEDDSPHPMETKGGKADMGVGSRPGITLTRDF